MSLLHSKITRKFQLDQPVLQQDGAPAHRSIEMNDFLDSKGIDVLNWAPQSPDLNIIENVWAQMKKELNKKQFDSVESLKQGVLEAWNNITPEYCKKLYESLENRFKSVKKAHGAHTKY